MDTGASIKGYLDSLSQLPGSILYRDRLNWLALPPGNPGQALTLNSSLLPEWANSYSYQPSTLFYPGTNGYQYRSQNIGGNSYFFFVFFSTKPRTGTAFRCIVESTQLSATTIRLGVYVGDSSHPTAPNRIFIKTYADSGSLLFSLIPDIDIADEQMHSLFVAFNASNAKSFCRLDGIAYSPILANVGTIRPWTRYHYIGLAYNNPSSYWHGDIGAIGYQWGYKENWNDFIDSENKPVPISPSDWSPFNSQPVYYHPNGDLRGNFGYQGAWAAANSQWINNPYAI